MVSQNPTASNSFQSTDRPPVRSIRHAHWCWMANDIADRYGALLGLDGLGLYITLARFANNRTGQCWPSLGRLSLATGADEDHLARLLEHLVSLGLITVQERPGRAPLISMLAVISGEAGNTSSFTPKPEPEPEPVAQVSCAREELKEEDKVCIVLSGEEEREKEVTMVPPAQEQPEQRRTFSSAKVQGKDKPTDETPSWTKPAVQHDATRPDEALAALGLVPEQYAALEAAARARIAQDGHSRGFVFSGHVHAVMLDIFEEWQASAPPCCPTHETETDGCTHGGCDDDGVCPRCGEFVTLAMVSE